MILAAGAARVKVPLIMVSGDDQLEREIRRSMPWVKYATTKRAIDMGRAVTVGREEASRRIEAAAHEALTKLAEAKIPDWPGPFRFGLTFQDAAQANNAGLLPGAEVNGSAVQIRAGDFEEGYRLSTRLISLASAIGRNTALNSVINAQPTAQQIRVSVTDWAYGRFLGTLPLPAAATTATARPRFWGAR